MPPRRLSVRAFPLPEFMPQTQMGFIRSKRQTQGQQVTVWADPPHTWAFQGWQQSRWIGELLFKSFYYLTVFLVCLSHFPHWAVAFLFPRVLGTDSADKHP